MSRLRRGTSLWLDQHAGGGPSHRGLKGRHEADVAIVGGGITGCVTAHKLARSGLRVVVLESQRLGRGSTSASTALLMQEPDADFGDLATRYDTRTANAVWRLSRRAVQGMVRAIVRLGDGVGLRHVPSVYFTRSADELRSLRREVRARDNAGSRNRWLDPDSLRNLAGIHGAGAILTHGNAQVDPYRTCLAFARAAERAGAAIHEHTTVRRIKAHPASVEVVTEHGVVDARWVVVATGYATPEFKPLAGRFRMMHTYVIATPPLSAAERRQVGLGDIMLWDTARPYHYGRWTSDRRLLFGGGDRPAARKTRAATLQTRITGLLDDLRDLYPAAARFTPDYAWEGRFATTPDGLPYIGAHRRYPRHLFALGYGGNGMTFGFLAGGVLERMIRGRSTADDELFRFSR